MRPVHPSPYLLRFLTFFASFTFALATPLVNRDDSGPLFLDLSPAPPPEKGAPLSAAALRDPAYLPAQIGGIVGTYAFSLVLVAVLLLILSKGRREAISNGEEEAAFDEFKPKVVEPSLPPQSPRSIPRSPVRNFSYPSPTRSEFQQQHDFHSTPYVQPSSASSLVAPGIDLSVDQRVVAADREMAQNQLEEMYKYVMEQDEAKQQGIVLDTPVVAPSSASDKSSVISKKERVKPASLNLAASGAESERTQSRTSSILSALRSPRKKAMKGISISSPIMTPMSGTFPRPESQEMSTIPPRQYAPAPPPPVPTNQLPYGVQRNHGQISPITPGQPGHDARSIDERIIAQFAGSHSRNTSAAPTEGGDPSSAVSEHSQAPLVGLPSSPKPSVTRFPTLPSSPKPGASFQRPNVPSAVRTGGSLPLRAYEPALTSPSSTTLQTKQTTFERMAPLSPAGGRTPFTGAAVPYSPYQPFTPCVPMTPSLVTRADRKRMRKLEPKTPTLELVRSSEDIW